MGIDGEIGRWGEREITTERLQLRITSSSILYGALLIIWKKHTRQKKSGMFDGY
jgi:hypothetical protein